MARRQTCDEFPMERSRRAIFLRNIPDIRDFRDLKPKDSLPDDPEDVKHLGGGERYWITQAAPLLHRQLVQILNVGAFITQEIAGSLGTIKDGSIAGLELEEVQPIHIF